MEGVTAVDGITAGVDAANGRREADGVAAEVDSGSGIFGSSAKLNRDRYLSRTSACNSEFICEVMDGGDAGSAGSTTVGSPDTTLSVISMS